MHWRWFTICAVAVAASCDDAVIHVSTGPGLDGGIRVDAAPVRGTQHPIGVPVGPFHLPTSDFDEPYCTGTFRILTPDSAVAVMQEAQDQFFDLYVNLAGSREFFQNPDSSFCLPCFKTRLDQFVGINFTPYVQSGTVRGHMLFDEPHDPSNWGGQPVSYEDIDSAASYSRQLFPGLPTGVGGPPTYLVGGAPYSKLNFGFAHYTTQKGGIYQFRIDEVAAARAGGIGVLFSLNVLGGKNGGPMTTYDLEYWGKVLACEPYSLGVLMWKFDSTLFADSAMQAAVLNVSIVANLGRVYDPVCDVRRD